MASKISDIAVTDFIQAIGQLVRRVRAAAVAHELSLTESMVMGRLFKHGPASTADLARAEGVKPQSMGTTIAGLEDRGFVERKPHPTDGRQLNIQLTAKGAAIRKSVGDAKQMWVAQAISQLGEDERETLFAAGKIIRRMVEQQ
jgi:DNA-binding MarR family transcriptional regulator